MFITINSESIWSYAFPFFFILLYFYLHWFYIYRKFTRFRVDHVVFAVLKLLKLQFVQLRKQSPLYYYWPYFIIHSSLCFPNVRFLFENYSFGQGIALHMASPGSSLQHAIWSSSTARRDSWVQSESILSIIGCSPLTKQKKEFQFHTSYFW